MVPSTARRTSALTREELRSIANESLLRAAQLFDASRGVPFDGYAFRFVRLDLQRAIGEEGARRRSEIALLSAGCDALDRFGLPDPFASGTEHARLFADALEGMFAEVIARYLGAASRGLDESELGATLDRAARFRKEVRDLGARGEVLQLRYLEELGWDEVAFRLGVSLATARRDHDESLRIVMARLAA